jgi:Zn-dependent M28 family amino/carboxypeptidase
MNYDMVGSPNYIFIVYDADESTFEAPVPVPARSTAIEDLYESYYTAIGEPYDYTEFSGRSDYQAFIEAGIPSSGLFTGAEEIKTAEQEAIWVDRRRAVRPVLPRGLRHFRERRPGSCG